MAVQLYDAVGNLVKIMTFPAGAQGGLQGQNMITWDGKNGRGDTVASGVYIGLLRAKALGGKEFRIRRKLGVVR